MQSDTGAENGDMRICGLTRRCCCCCRKRAKTGRNTGSFEELLTSLGTFLVTMGHDWSHSIDRKTVSDNTDEKYIE
jgi:hypothetical protein